MDFTLALTHFCEAHGPKSVLCTQVLPLECALCLPPSPSLKASSSTESLTTQVHDSPLDQNHNLHTPPPLRKTDTNITLPTDFSGASTTVDSETEPDRPAIEKHPLFQNVDQKRNVSSQWRYGRAQGDTCASCSFSVPKAIAEKLPAGAPGSKTTDGKGPNTGAPVLRSREFVCLRERRRSNANDASRGSKPSSYGSSVASSCSRNSSQLPSSPRRHPDNCHDHTLTYLTAKSPDDPECYARLRASVIRTLSCELLPRGMSDGPFCFGDSNSGYTIAYVFRLTDPKARGRRRAYAFVALAGKDASRAFQACPMLWEAFANMAKGIEAAAQRHQERQRQKEEEAAEAAESLKTNSTKYTPVSSFLTPRTVDPDGHPRRVGHATPRSLADIVGDENIFTFLHQYFVAILRCLGDQFGGLPLAEKPSVYQSVSEESPSPAFTQAKASVGAGHADKLDHRHLERLRDEDTTPKPPHSEAATVQERDKQQAPGTTLAAASFVTMPNGQHRATQEAPETEIETETEASKDRDDLEVAKTRANKAFKLTPPCAPLAVNETAQRQVVV
ncbi:hypothetical protein A1O1_03185 [Capronia coronata CBS 617.96]|uniref:UDENN FLCN/SMCR8-type domain-containing protein n=1 Tax=Capronia coronata CBS 617.96 TaxID=1182541 RepID=W9YPC5_9EURO|nr:uncharacterized protein A1O1_03185 [Capronia coronata CBS 617.96]EXJ94787.1 hypothetical protein A1O1_03185 [Capronia coronata CBS 617.96]